MTKATCLSVVCCLALPALSQSLPQQYNAALFTKPLVYTAVRSTEPVAIDGNLSETGWQQAPWSEVFTDIEGDAKTAPTFATRVKMIWDDTCLYVAAQLDEPQLQASLRQHDTIIFHDNDFEIFIDPDNNTHQYFEIEVNALNSIFDLLMPRPYRNNSDALIGYDVQGLQSAVQLHGTLNNSSDTDTGWTVEMTIPFRALNFGFRTRFTPVEGSFYRINFSRVEWDWNLANGRYIKRTAANGSRLPEHNWVWSPQGIINMHYPERWGYVVFGKSGANYTIPATEEAKNYLVADLLQTESVLPQSQTLCSQSVAVTGSGYGRSGTPKMVAFTQCYGTAVSRHFANCRRFTNVYH